jgi:urate oxidase
MQKQYAITQHSYGKNQVHLTKVSRHNGQDSLTELTADVKLEGEFESAYMDGDNRLIVPTDTMKNTLYVLAQKNGVPNLELFGCTVVNHFLDCYQHVTHVTVRLWEHLWQRILVGGKSHPHAFCASGGECFTSVVSGDRAKLRITSGIDGLAVLKTRGSGFQNFLKDQYTTLEETEDRILATTITANWNYRDAASKWSACRRRIRETLLEVFATHQSRSVQHTLYAMASAALDVCDGLQSITLRMPNQHRILVDLEPFGLVNSDELFVPTTAPQGIIQATVNRDKVS